jgi:hypothetical protein
MSRFPADGADMGRMLPIIASRPDDPRSWRRCTAPMTLILHHVIPFHLLRDSWNLVARCAHEAQAPEPHRAARQFLALVASRTLGNLEHYDAGVRDASLDVVECHQIEQRVVWPPWNIVEGPRERSDDPGEHGLDRFTHGLRPYEAIRMQRAEALFRVLETFFRSGRTDFALLGWLADEISFLRPELVCDAPIYYREEMWEPDGPSRWRKRRS